jgi:hypothetical protein
MPLTSGPSHAETAVRMRMRNHYGAITEGLRCPITSVPHDVCAAPPEKAHPLCTTAATTAVI